MTTNNYHQKLFKSCHELTKREKKIARFLIDKGLDIEFRTALEQAAEILAEWQKDGMDNITAYQKLFKKLRERDKAIARRYDDQRGSTYLLIVAQIYADGQITEEDIKDFSEDSRAFLNNWLQWSKEE